MSRKSHEKAVRIRFRIDAGGIIYVVIAALILAVAVYTQANLLFWAFGLMVGGLFVSVGLSWLMMRGLQVQRIVPSHGVAGEAFVLRYHVVNPKLWMPAFNLVIRETWGRPRWFRKSWLCDGPIAQKPPRLRGRPHGWILHLGPGQTAQAEAPCWALRRGPLQFERIEISSSFPFGVVRRIVEVRQAGEVLIYPHLYRINRRLLFRLSAIDPMGKKRLERAGGAEEFFGLRQYRAGDSLRMIDWKRSAKTGQLISREMTQPSPPKIMVALDLTPDAAKMHAAAPKRSLFRRSAQIDTAAQYDHAVELAISLTASLICDAHFNGYQVGLAVVGLPCRAFPVHHSLPHRMHMLEALSRLDLSQRSGEPQPIPAEPSVVVRPGAGQDLGPGHTGRRMILGTDQLDQYVMEAEGGSQAVLGRQAAKRARRQQVGRAQAWA